MRNNFNKWIFFAQNGELKSRDSDEERETLKAMVLMGNIVAYWNAQKINEAVAELRKQGVKIKDTDIKFITPYRTTGINRYGIYDFGIEKRKKLKKE